jgi:L-lactate utilization protein LutB
MLNDTSDKTITTELSQFYEIRSATVIKSLVKRGMEGHFVANRQEALQYAMTLIPSDVVVARGDSVTLNQVGIIPALMERNQNKIINPVQTDAEGHHLPREGRRVLQREAFLSDVFLTSTNAITLDGKLVNIDGAGNRVAAMMFGPKKVIVITGANKIVTDVDEALHRIHNVVSPLNSIRHHNKHQQAEAIERPCIKIGKCVDCMNEYRVCRNTGIIAGCQPAERGRISVILVGEDLGI